MTIPVFAAFVTPIFIVIAIWTYILPELLHRLWISDYDQAFRDYANSKISRENHDRIGDEHYLDHPPHRTEFEFMLRTQERLERAAQWIHARIQR